MVTIRAIAITKRSFSDIAINKKTSTIMIIKPVNSIPNNFLKFSSDI